MITMTQRRATSFFERSSGRYRPRDSTSTTFAAQRIERTSWIHSLQARSSDPGGTLQPATTGLDRHRGGGRRRGGLTRLSLIASTLQPLSTAAATRSEEHTSELQSLLRISYAVFCLKKK